MDRLLERLKKEHDEDIALLSQIRGLIKDAPEGSLRISLINGHVRYYWTKNGESTYIRKKNEQLASRLANKEYLLKLKQLLEQELKTIGTFLKRYQPSEKTALYSALHPGKQNLITPVLLPDETYITEWKNEHLMKRSQQPNTFPLNRSFQTKEGSAVRSKSEKIIADLLYDLGIPYVYEAPFFSKGGVFFPDFTVLNVRTRTTVYWEHFGMMDNADYSACIPQKIKDYERAGIRLGETLIATFEMAATPIDVINVKAWIYRMLL